MKQRFLWTRRTLAGLAVSALVTPTILFGGAQLVYAASSASSPAQLQQLLDQCTGEIVLNTDISVGRTPDPTVNADPSANPDLSSSSGWGFKIPSSCTSTVNINGNGHRITASEMLGNGMFVMTNAQVNFTNITLDGTGKARLVNAQNSQLSFTDSNIEHGSSAGSNDGQGGGILFQGGSLTLRGGSVSDNHTGSPTTSPLLPEDRKPQLGGGISAYKGSIITVENTSFTNNVANGPGGAIALNDKSQITLNRANFSGNHLAGYSGSYQGGAIYLSDSTITDTASTYTTSSPFNTGGAVRLLSATGTFTNTKFNIPKGLGDGYGTSGGSIASEGSHLTLNNCEFTLSESKLEFEGGALLILGSGTFNMNGGFIKGPGTWFNGPRQATYGGAISFGTNYDYSLNPPLPSEANPSTVKATLKDVEISGIAADKTGGAITVSTKKGDRSAFDLILDHVTIGATRALDWRRDNYGGAIYVGPGNKLTLKGGTVIKDEHVSALGGIIYNEGTTDIQTAELYGGWGTSLGGAIHNNGTLRLDKVNFGWNDASEAKGFFPLDPKKTAGEYAGGNVYGEKDFTITANTPALTDGKDFRIIDKQSKLLLAGTPSGIFNITISELSSAATGAVPAENAHRRIGYLVAEGSEGYTATKADANKLHYLSRDKTVSPAKDHISLGTWDFVLNKIHQVVAGQRGNVVYVLNAPATGPVIQSAPTLGDGDTLAEDKQTFTQLRDIYGFDEATKLYLSDPTNQVDPAQAENYPLVVANPLEKQYRFLGWFNKQFAPKDFENCLPNKITDKLWFHSEKAPFGHSEISGGSTPCSEANFGEISSQPEEILNPNTVKAYGGWLPLHHVNYRFDLLPGEEGTLPEAVKELAKSLNYEGHTKLNLVNEAGTQRLGESNITGNAGAMNSAQKLDTTANAWSISGLAKSDTFSLDTPKTAKIVVEGKTWEFVKWNTTDNVIDTGDREVVGYWRNATGYSVSYRYKSADTAVSLPEEIAASARKLGFDGTNPSGKDPVTVRGSAGDKDPSRNAWTITPLYKNATYPLSKPPVSEQKVSEVTWRFDHWESPDGTSLSGSDNGTMSDGSLEVIGVWKPYYQVKYKFVSDTDTKELPAGVTDQLLKQETDQSNGTTFTPNSDFHPVKDGEGTWKFVKWDKSSQTIDHSNLEFVGHWLWERDLRKPTHLQASFTANVDKETSYQWNLTKVRDKVEYQAKDSITKASFTVSASPQVAKSAYLHLSGNVQITNTSANPSAVYTVKVTYGEDTLCQQFENQAELPGNGDKSFTFSCDLPENTTEIPQVSVKVIPQSFAGADQPDTVTNPASKAASQGQETFRNKIVTITDSKYIFPGEWHADATQGKVSKSYTLTLQENDQCFDNTVTLNGDNRVELAKATVSNTCPVKPVRLSASLNASYEKEITYPWSLAKEVVSTAPGDTAGTAKVNYRVSATPGKVKIKFGKIEGTLTITNIDTENASSVYNVAINYGETADTTQHTCSVFNDQEAIPAGGRVVLPYSCEISDSIAVDKDPVVAAKVTANEETIKITDPETVTASEKTIEKHRQVTISDDHFTFDPEFKVDALTDKETTLTREYTLSIDKCTGNTASLTADDDNSYQLQASTKPICPLAVLIPSTCSVYPVSYKFISASGQELPAEVLELKPADQPENSDKTLADGEPVVAKEIVLDSGENPGTWVLDSWTKNMVENSKCAQVWVAKWVFTPEDKPDPKPNPKPNPEPKPIPDPSPDPSPVPVPTPNPNQPPVPSPKLDKPPSPSVYLENMPNTGIGYEGRLLGIALLSIGIGSGLYLIQRRRVKSQ